jgi:hypothetical protein
MRFYFPAGPHGRQRFCSPAGRRACAVSPFYPIKAKSENHKTINGVTYIPENRSHGQMLYGRNAVIRNLVLAYVFKYQCIMLPDMFGFSISFAIPGVGLTAQFNKFS